MKICSMRRCGSSGRVRSSCQKLQPAYMTIKWPGSVTSVGLYDTQVWPLLGLSALELGRAREIHRPTFSACGTGSHRARFAGRCGRGGGRSDRLAPSPRQGLRIDRTPVVFVRRDRRFSEQIFRRSDPLRCLLAKRLSAKSVDGDAGSLASRLRHLVRVHLSRSLRARVTSHRRPAWSTRRRLGRFLPANAAGGARSQRPASSHYRSRPCPQSVRSRPVRQPMGRADENSRPCLATPACAVSRTGIWRTRSGPTGAAAKVLRPAVFWRTAGGASRQSVT
jgi:hypothetical protein